MNAPANPTAVDLPVLTAADHRDTATQRMDTAYAGRVEQWAATVDTCAEFACKLTLLDPATGAETHPAMQCPGSWLVLLARRRAEVAS